MTNVSHASLTGADLHEPKGISTVPANQVYVSNGSGSGTWIDAGSVISNSAWSTGDAKTTFVSTAPTGWILVNDGTLGDGSSGATTRANADTQALFLLLWALPINLTVSGGRGASAAADYAAHKTIQVPLFLGRVLGVAGAGAGLTSRQQGANVGTETNTIAQNQLPNVSPGFSGSSQTWNTNQSGVPFGCNNFLMNSGSGGGIFVPQSNGTSYGALSVTITPSGTVSSINGGVTQQATNNMQPSTFLNLLIKL